MAVSHGGYVQLTASNITTSSITITLKAMLGVNGDSYNGSARYSISCSNGTGTGNLQAPVKWIYGNSYETLGSYTFTGLAEGTQYTFSGDFYCEALNINVSWSGSASINASTTSNPRYTVSYAANGGSSTPSSQTGTYGTVITLASAISRSNSTGSTYTATFNANGGSVSPTSRSATETTSYIFAYWTDSNGGIHYANSSHTIIGNTTMTAQWYSYPSSANVTLPTPTRSGYTFNGWSTSQYASSGSYWGGSSVTLTGNTTFYATWSMNAPSGLSLTYVSSTTDSISYRWSASGVSITNYTLFYKKAGTTTYSSKSFGTATSGTLDGLEIDTNYQVYLSVTNGGGTSNTSNSVLTNSTKLTNPTISDIDISDLLPFNCVGSAVGSISPSRTLTYSFSIDDADVWTAYQSNNSYNWTGLNQEHEYTLWVRVKASSLGLNASDTYATTSLRIVTPRDHLRVQEKINNDWKMGGVYYKKNGNWKKVKDGYFKTNNEWKQIKNPYKD